MIRINHTPAAMTSLLLMALVAGCAAGPGEPPATTGYANIDQVESDPERMVCRTQQDTGSRLSSRVCKTAREWEQERADNQEAIRNATRSGMPPGNMPTAGGG